jgi:hypothetical protein
MINNNNRLSELKYFLIGTAQHPSIPTAQVAQVSNSPRAEEPTNMLKNRLYSAPPYLPTVVKAACRQK